MICYLKSLGHSLTKGRLLWPSVLGILLTNVLAWIAFAPWNVAEAAYCFALPLLFCLLRCQTLKSALAISSISSFLFWFFTLFWLRHVTWGGLILLACYLSLFSIIWWLAAWWSLPRLLTTKSGKRLLGLLGLAALWALLEYSRGVLFTGFPWLPLAASQAFRPTALQSIAFTGYYGLSFVLIFFNLGLFSALYNWKDFNREKRVIWWPKQELAVAIGLILLNFSLVFTVPYFEKDSEELFTAGIVQPYIPQNLKWSPDAAERNLAILMEETSKAHSLGVDVVLWPESATPYPLWRNGKIRNWVAEYVRSTQLPLLMGNMAVEGQDWYNVIGAIDGKVQNLEFTPYYAKRRLVPFGEYVPGKRWFPFIDQWVPIGEFTPGNDPKGILINIRGKEYKVGGLVCYEDIFPQLARSTARAGIDLFFVATNNAWYGEEAGAYQHAAHSILRAVETRRTVLRCGNGGWSGWIDPYGRVRSVVTDSKHPEKDIYFRGTQAISIKSNSFWKERQSFYVLKGDWFPLACLALLLLSVMVLVLDCSKAKKRRKGLDTEC